MSFLPPENAIRASEISKTFNTVFKDEQYWKKYLTTIPRETKFCFFVYRREIDTSLQFEKKLLFYNFKNHDFSNWKEITKEERIEIFKKFCEFNDSPDFQHYKVKHDIFGYGTVFSTSWFEPEAPRPISNETRERVGFKKYLAFRVDNWTVVQTKFTSKYVNRSFNDVISNGLGFFGSLASQVEGLYKLM
eukprot:gene11529-4782_t